MKELKALKELYLEEIKKINKKGELTPVDAEAAKKALEAIKSIDEICCEYDNMDMEENERGYSERMMPRRSISMNRYPGQYPVSRRMPDMMHFGYGYNDGHSYDDGYRAGYSDRRGRSQMTGRYISRHAEPVVDNMIHKLEDMKLDAPDDEIRMAIDRMIDKLENY